MEEEAYRCSEKFLEEAMKGGRVHGSA